MFGLGKQRLSTAELAAALADACGVDGPNAAEPIASPGVDQRAFVREEKLLCIFALRCAIRDTIADQRRANDVWTQALPHLIDAGRSLWVEPARTIKERVRAYDVAVPATGAIDGLLLGAAFCGFLGHTPRADIAMGAVAAWRFQRDQLSKFIRDALSRYRLG